MDYLQRAKSFRAKKRLGQNFLVDESVIQAILDNAGISKEDTIIEIGAGLGFVTEQLVKHAGKVIAIELDEDAIEELEKIKCGNLEVVHQDILKTGLSDFAAEKVKIVANIPYYITSPIIAHLLGEIDDLDNKNRNSISEIILMVQQEVAQRIVATETGYSKDYGLLSILAQFWADCEIIKKVPRKCFFPSPNVDSALVKFKVRQEPKIKLSNYTHFRKTIKAAFSQRRKNIKNCLLAGGFLRENIDAALQNAEIPENERAENISIEKFGQLSEYLLKTESAQNGLVQENQLLASQDKTQIQTIKEYVNKKEIKVSCPAKINLTLEVVDRREDGYHSIQSVMQAVNLFDTLHIKIEKSDDKINKFTLNLSGTSEEIPYDERNLVHKAVLSYFDNPKFSMVYDSGRADSAPEGGVEEITASKAKIIKEVSTSPEQVLWYYLKEGRFHGLVFKAKTLVENCIADFVCFDKKLVIELDSSNHLPEKTIELNRKKDSYFQSIGYKVLRFTNSEIFNETEKVLDLIRQKVSSSSRFQGFASLGKAEQKTIGGNYKISIHIEKNIPIAAGLAGGSTDAAGTLWGLNKLFNNALSQEELHKLCAGLGSDLNFCLEGGCQLATGRGEILHKLPFVEFDVSLIKPKNLGLKAKDAYEKFVKLQIKPNLNRTKKLVELIKSGQKDFERYLHNDLEVAIINDYIDLQEIKSVYPTSIMSGSGSTFFILRDKVKNISEEYWIKTSLKSIPYGVTEKI